MYVCMYVYKEISLNNHLKRNVPFLQGAGDTFHGKIYKNKRRKGAILKLCMPPSQTTSNTNDESNDHNGAGSDSEYNLS